MKRNLTFRDRPMPPAVEVTHRAGGALDRLVKCSTPTCRSRRYETILDPEVPCFSCGGMFTANPVVRTEDHLYKLYGSRRLFS